MLTRLFTDSIYFLRHSPRYLLLEAFVHAEEELKRTTRKSKNPAEFSRGPLWNPFFLILYSTFGTEPTQVERVKVSGLAE